ncbi:MAG: class I SAM-dependent methyltransferase [Leptospira sp.]|nr:class I SAM-dependent methyltransferase [Leptospira sp.]
MSTDAQMHNIIENRFPEQFEEIQKIFDFAKISEFHDFLMRENFKGGFFSKSDAGHVMDRHILESLYHVYLIQKLIPVSRETKIADVGTGPGLPGYLFYCLRIFPKLTLIDSQKRKLQWLEKFHTESSGNRDIRFLYSRAEEIKEKFSIVITRSTIPYPWSAEVMSLMLTSNGYFIPFLGKADYDRELENKILEYSGFEPEKTIYISELNFLGMRHIKLLKKVRNPKYGYPRIWKIVSKEIKEQNGKSSIDQ